MIQQTSKFWKNFALFIASLIALGIALWACFAKCKDTFAVEILDPNDCLNSPLSDECEMYGECEELENCVNTMNVLGTNIGSQYWGQPANRKLHIDAVYPGSFGNPNVLD